MLMVLYKQAKEGGDKKIEKPKEPKPPEGLSIKDVRRQIPSGGFEGKYADYFTQLGERSKGREFFLGTPIDHIRGKCKETFIQVMNGGFPAGLMEPADAINLMEGACYKG